MKDKFLQLWNDFLEGLIQEYHLTRRKVLKLFLVFVLSGIAVFMAGRCSVVIANDRHPPKQDTPQQPQQKEWCIQNSGHKTVCALGVAGGVYGVWYFNQKGSEKKQPEVGVHLRK